MSLSMDSFKLDYPNPYKRGVLPFAPQENLLAGGGPVNFSTRVLKALGHQTLPPLSPNTFKVLQDIRQLGQYIYQTKSEYVMAVQLSGNGGNETCVLNLLDPGEKALVAIGGYWGEIVVDMCKRYNVNVLGLRKEPGEIYNNEELEEAIKQFRPKALFVTHGESTGSILHPLEGLGEICHRYDCLLVVDATVSAGVIPLHMDRWKIDAISAGVQKGLGAPAGLSLIALSPRAVAKMRSKKHQPPWVMDLTGLEAAWGITDGPLRYRYTYSSHSLCALREALIEICEEGLENVWARHKATSELFYRELERINLKIFVKKPENRFYGVTGVCYPSDIDEKKFLQHLLEKHQVDITPGYGPTFKVAMRVGLMGPNSRPEVVRYLINAFQESIDYLRKNRSNGVCH